LVANHAIPTLTDNSNAISMSKSGKITAVRKYRTDTCIRADLFGRIHIRIANFFAVLGIYFCNMDFNIITIVDKIKFAIVNVAVN
jgi:hypothetical protein